MAGNSRRFLSTRTAAALACCLVWAFAGSAQAYAGQELAKTARVSLSEARGIALKAHPGKITDQELEKESGGSGLRYSFDISDGVKTYEVGVDAQNGAVLQNSAEGKNAD